MDNLGGIIEGHDPDSIALISRGRSTTYGELNRQVAALRGGLGELGIGRGDVVGIACHNGRHFVVSYLAVVGIGAVAAPLNPASPAAEMARELGTIDAMAVIAEPTANGTVSTIASSLPTLRHVIDIPQLDELLEHQPAPLVDVAADDLAVLVFTSGTAGAPRAAMLSHGNLLANIRQHHNVPDRLQPSDVVYGVLPPFHIYGLNVAIAATLHAGACVVLVQRFDPSTAIDTIAQRGVTVLLGAPPMWVAFAQMPDLPPDAFAKVRLAFSGAAKMPEHAADALEQRHGLVLREGYGLTEASPVVTTSVGIPPRRGSVGRAVDGVEVRLVDESGGDALEGDTGEIWVKGPNVFLGYLHDADATARVLGTDPADRWLRTGDVAVADADGYLYLVDRAKDLIIVSGFNVYPAEVEDALLEYPGVSEAAVIGVSHPHTGEAVKAYVVPEAGAHLDEDTLIDHCQERLARYKCPSKVLFVDELPRNLSGKLLRRQLT